MRGETIKPFEPFGRLCVLPSASKSLIKGVAMTFVHPPIRVGASQQFESISVFPLFADNGSQVEYLLSDEAFATKQVTVNEISEQGSVPELLVENTSASRVLFLEGEELIGAKQNRILNTSVLVAANSKTRIPVSCVEQGRWRYRSKEFSPSRRHSPRRLRKALKSGVSSSLGRSEGHRSNQQEVWKEVAKYDSAFAVHSPTHAMADTFEKQKSKLDEAQAKLRYVDGAQGVAVALGPDVVCIELFDKPETCRKVWDRILSGLILDALCEASDGKRAEVADVEKLLTASTSAAWAEVDAVAEGQEYRAEFGKEHASALCFQNQLIHGSVIGA
jgi:hypothetical protein